MQTQARNGAQVVEGDLVGVTVVVADAGRDQGRARMGGAQQGGTRAGLGSVMADLQDIDPGQEPAFGQHRLDRHLRITGQQGGEATAAQQAHDRRVVDVSLGKRPGHVLCARIEEGERRRGIQPQPCSGSC